jgi:hypothetical protein
MSWGLRFSEEVLKYFAEGRDNHRRMSLHHIFVEKAELPALQVGVPHRAEGKHSPEWTSIDLFDDRPCIDHKMDLLDLKFGDYNFKTIECNAILEHVKNPFLAVSEMYRVADYGCKIWVEAPFVQTYHPYKNYTEDKGIIFDNEILGSDSQHGGDYFRFTPQGLIEIMKPFKLLEIMLTEQGGLAYYGVKGSV